MNSTLFLFAAIPAILYKRLAIRKLYETYMNIGMTLQEVSQALQVKPTLATSSVGESDSQIEVFECENNSPEKFILVFINGKLNKWYTELKQTIQE